MINFFSFVTEHWQFCLLHFLEFGIWGAWFVVLGNILDARGFSRAEIGRIYGTIPIGTMISIIAVGALVDRYLETQHVIAVSHLIGGLLLLVMARTYRPWPFFGLSLAYAIFFAPTLGLVNSIIFAHDDDIFGGAATEGFPWIRVFGTIGWIIAGLSHALILKKNAPVDSRPIYLAAGLSFVLAAFAVTLPSTPPQGPSETGIGLVEGTLGMISSNPIFFLVTVVAAMAMGLYFAFAALFLEKTGVPSRTVGPVMTLGQWIEIFFMLMLPTFLGPDNVRMNLVLGIGIFAWALRFVLFAIGRPLALVLAGIAIHGICFDFFFAAGFINADLIAPEDLKATAQGVYGFLVYGLGMYLGSEAAGWLNQACTQRTVDDAGVEAAPAAAGDAVLVADGDEAAIASQTDQTNWRLFWSIPAGVVAVGAVLFVLLR